MESDFPVNSGRFFRLAAAVLLGILFIGALAVSWTIPFQEWDAYSIGIWSRLIADGDPILSPKIDPIAHQRPLVPVPQGLIWRWIGHPSMRAGRMLSLSFSVLLVIVTFLLSRRFDADQTTVWIAAFLAGASPLVTEKVSATMSDIPSAALFWAGVLTMLSAREKRSVFLWLCTGTLWGLSALGKVTALPLCAGFAATTLLYGVRRRWNWWSWLAMAIGLVVPGYAVYSYWNLVRSPLDWAHFLYGWNVPYYGELARSARLPALTRFNWFGVLLTIVFVVALISRLSARSRIISLLALIAVGVWAIAALLGSPAAVRAYESGRFDALIAGGVAAIAAVLCLAVAHTRSEAGPPGRSIFELLSVSALYFLAWIVKFGYDRRFLVAILPPIAICAARWLRAIGEVAGVKRSPLLIAATVLACSAIAGEGARLMDRGYPVFSRAMVSINRRHGLSPEGKMQEIFGDNMRIIDEVQQKIASRPGLRIISPDTRLPFFFGSHLDAFYATPANIGNYDLLIWVNNSGVLEQYRMVYGIADPLNALRKTVHLTAIDRTAEYELYGVSQR